MSDSTLDDIKSGKGLEHLGSGDTSKSGITTERRSADHLRTQNNPGITRETFNHHSNYNTRKRE